MVIDCHNPFNFTEDLDAIFDGTADYLGNEHQTRLYRIFDFHEIEMTFNDLVEGLATKTRQRPGSLRDARVYNVLVGTHELIKMKADSLGQRQYGELDVPLFETLDAAIAHCKKHQMTRSRP